AGFLIRATRTPIREADPVVHAVQPKFSPCETGAQSHRLAADAATEELVAADEDPALAVAAHPVDAEDAGRSHRLVLIGDGPLDRRRTLSGLLEARLRSLVGDFGE